MEQGPVEQSILQQCMRERLPLPERIQNAPELQLGLELYYGAFFDLTLGDGIIRWVDIHDYCQRLGLSEEQEEDMHHHLRAMFDAYVKWRETKNG